MLYVCFNRVYVLVMNIPFNIFPSKFRTEHLPLEALMKQKQDKAGLEPLTAANILTSNIDEKKINFATFIAILFLIWQA